MAGRRNAGTRPLAERRPLNMRSGGADDDWRQYAVCRDHDPELFFPAGTSGPALLRIERAKTVCRSCPAIDECLRWAFAAGIDCGVWGGMTEEERRAVNRRGGIGVRAGGYVPPAGSEVAVDAARCNRGGRS
jgi:WhiB family redox-sensing transcriptional regulator